MFKRLSKKSFQGVMIFSMLVGMLFLSTGCAKILELAKEASKAIDNSGILDQGKISISGKIMSLTSVTENISTAISDAQIKAVVKSSSGQTIEEKPGNSDSSGYYTLKVKSIENAATIVLTITKSGYISKTKTLTAQIDYHTTDSQINVEDILLAKDTATGIPMGKISGTVRCGVYPIPDAEVSITSTTDQGKSIRTDDKGKYVLDGLQLGTTDGVEYTLTVTKNGYIVKTSPTQPIKLSIANPSAENKDFKLTATAENLKEYYAKAASLGIVYVGFIGPDQTDLSKMPSYIASASATITSIQDDKGNYPSEKINREDSSVIIYGIPISSNVTLELKMEEYNRTSATTQSGFVYRIKKYFSSAANTVQSHTYTVKSEALKANEDLPDIQKIKIGKDDFTFKKTVWIEKEIRGYVGGSDIPVENAKIVFTKGTATVTAYTDMRGWFGTALPSDGAWHFEIYYPKDAPASIFQGDATINLDQLMDPRAWWPGFIFLANIKVKTTSMATKHVEFQLKTETTTSFAPIYGPQVPMRQGANYTGAVTLVLYAQNDQQYRVTANAVSGQAGKYATDLAPLGDFKAYIAVGDVKLQDAGMSYWVDQYNTVTSYEIWVKESYVEAQGRVYVKAGNDLGVPMATVKLLRDGVEKVSTATRAEGGGVQAWEQGRYTLKIKETPDLFTGTWTLEISKENAIKKITIPVWFTQDAGGMVQTNLTSLTDIKAVMTNYFGRKFTEVYARLSTNDQAQLDKVKSAIVTLRFQGTNMEVTANSDAQGRVTFNNVPALDQEMEMQVQKGSDIGKSNGTFRFEHSDINNTYVTEAYVPWGQTQQSIWIEFSGFMLNDFFVGFRYNQRDFRLSGASILFTKADDATVTAGALSDDSGKFSKIYIPSDAAYNAVVSKTGFTNKTYTNKNLSRNTMTGNYGWDVNDIKLEMSSGTDVSTLITTASISGYVYQEQDSSAISGATVVFKPKYESKTFTTTTDSNGKYELTLPLVDEYKVSVNMTGYMELGRDEWINMNSQTQLPQIMLRLIGASGWWDVNDFEIKTAKVIENGIGVNGANPANSTATLYYFIRAKITKDGSALDTASASNKIVLVNAVTGEVVYEMEPVGAGGIWQVKGAVANNIFAGKALVATSAITAEKLRLEIKNATGFTLFPKDQWQIDRAERELPGFMDPPSYVSISAQTENSVTFTRIAWDNSYWAGLGLTGERYMIKFVGTSAQFSHRVYLDSYAGMNNTFTWDVSGWDWCEFASDSTWNSLNVKYTDNIPDGSYSIVFITADDLWNAKKLGVRSCTYTNPKYK